MTKKPKVARIVRARIEEGGPDTIWTYSDFAFLPPYAVAAALSRLSKKGVLKRVRKGLYYAPKETRFGKTVRILERSRQSSSTAMTLPGSPPAFPCITRSGSRLKFPLSPRSRSAATFGH